ncbi:hypothetical protein RchiOBHm_Chr5g0025021 [Rosa chinensis]|uniref:Uncharacterized protein n=1 Tax=Rosa chinensis TaxID=74649 RepID=A0A2P6Q8F9_ROSCH|nr:hypothetical protein RchiOBHm_Chr5g0025021 [Rosa chinensis]
MSIMGNTHFGCWVGILPAGFTQLKKCQLEKPQIPAAPIETNRPCDPPRKSPKLPQSIFQAMESGYCTFVDVGSGPYSPYLWRPRVTSSTKSTD